MALPSAMCLHLPETSFQTGLAKPPKKWVAGQRPALCLGMNCTGVNPELLFFGSLATLFALCVFFLLELMFNVLLHNSAQTSTTTMTTSSSITSSSSLVATTCLIWPLCLFWQLSCNMLRQILDAAILQRETTVRVHLSRDKDRDYVSEFNFHHFQSGQL